MPKISIRGAEMPASPIRRLIPFAEAAKKRGTHVFHLNIGQPDIETPSSFLDAIRNADLKVVEYSHSAGNESYRRKVAAYYQGRGLSVDTADVMITTGG
jgi:aspartate aminotransferase